MTDDRFDDSVQRIRSEYLQLPGLALTAAQARRLWDLDAPTCDSVLDELVKTHFLWKTQAQCFVRPEFKG